jgi:hypothetical protein
MTTRHYKEYVEENEAWRQEHSACGKAHGPRQIINPKTFTSGFSHIYNMASRSCEATTPCGTSGGVQRACITILPIKAQGLHLW